MWTWKNHNPFSATRVRPGKLPYLGNSFRISDLVRRWHGANYIGQIVGPHGTGKTTLSRAIESFVQDRFGRVNWLTIRHRSLRTDSLGTTTNYRICHMESKSGSIRGLYVVDGIENLGLLHRWLLVQRCRADMGGILITSHRKLAGIPVLAELTPVNATLQVIVRYLLGQWPYPDEVKAHFDASLVDAAFQDAGGNLRESLMMLYDSFEDLARKAA